jgi:hypothetical protein
MAEKHALLEDDLDFNLARRTAVVTGASACIGLAVDAVWRARRE